jgi:hypothetical protein
LKEPKDALSAVLKSRFGPSVDRDGFQPLGSRSFVRVRGDLFQFMTFHLTAFGGRRFCIDYSTTNLCEGWESFGWHNDVGGRFPGRPPTVLRSWWPFVPWSEGYFCWESLLRGRFPWRRAWLREHWWESLTVDLAEESMTSVLRVYEGFARGWFEATATPEGYLKALHEPRERFDKDAHNRFGAGCTLMRLGRMDEGRAEVELAKRLYLEDCAQNPGRDWCLELAARCDEVLAAPEPTLVRWRALSVKSLKIEQIKGA